MKICLFFLFISTIGQSNVLGSEANYCDKILENIELGPTEDFLTYILELVEDNQITKSSLDDFYQNLLNEQLINPVDHKMEKWGPVFEQSSKRASYFQLQKFIDAHKQNNHYIVISELREKLASKLALKSNELVERKSISKVANLFLLVESLGIQSQILTSILKPLSGLSRDFKINLAKTLIHNNKDSSTRLNQFAYELLTTVDHPYSWREIENIVLNDKETHFLHINEIIEDDGSQEFIDFVKRAMRSDLSDQFKLRLINKVKNIQSDDWRILIEDFLSKDLSYTYKNGLIQKYAKIKSDKVISFLEDIAYINVNSMRYTRVAALKALIDLGKGEEVFSPEKMKTLGKVMNHQESMAEDDYRAVIISELIISLAGSDDQNTLRSVLAIQKNAKEYFEKYGVTLLKGRSDNQSFEMIKKMYLPISSPKQVGDKLSMLTGRDDEWSLNYIENNSTYWGLTNSNLMLGSIEALAGTKSKRSRDILEKKYLEADGVFAFKIQQAVIEDFRDRPVGDIIYFLSKYHRTQNSTLTSKLFRYLNGVEHPTAVEIAKSHLKGKYGETLVMPALEYLSSLPNQTNLEFWKQLAQNDNRPKVKARALLNLAGNVDDESRVIFETALNDSSLEVVKAALSPYLFYYLYNLDKLSSTNKEELMKAELEVESWNHKLFKQALER